MFGGGGTSQGSITNGPGWDPAGNVSYRNWMREVVAWLNLTSARLTPTAQAAALQL